jgi:hypothetical protein
MWWTIVKVGIAAGTIVIVSEVAPRLPRVGALLLTLPVISIIAFIMTWLEYHDLAAVSRLSRETLVLVPLGLPFFVPLGFADKLGLAFWPALGAGLAFASITIGLYLWLGPSRL